MEEANVISANVTEGETSEIADEELDYFLMLYSFWRMNISYNKLYDA